MAHELCAGGSFTFDNLLRLWLSMRGMSISQTGFVFLFSQFYCPCRLGLEQTFSHHNPKVHPYVGGGHRSLNGALALLPALPQASWHSAPEFDI
jgi:hypothetical protein